MLPAHWICGNHVGTANGNWLASSSADPAKAAPLQGRLYADHSEVFPDAIAAALKKPATA